MTVHTTDPTIPDVATELCLDIYSCCIAILCGCFSGYYSTSFLTNSPLGMMAKKSILVATVLFTFNIRLPHAPASPLRLDVARGAAVPEQRRLCSGVEVRWTAGIGRPGSLVSPAVDQESGFAHEGRRAVHTEFCTRHSSSGEG